MHHKALPTFPVRSRQTLHIREQPAEVDIDCTGDRWCCPTTGSNTYRHGAHDSLAIYITKVFYISLQAHGPELAYHHHHHLEFV